MNGTAANAKAVAERYIDGLARLEGDWLTSRRRAAAKRIEELGFPVRGQEKWRYTSIDGLLEQEFQPLEGGAGTLSPDQVAQLQLDGPKAGALVFVDGEFQPGLSSLPAQGMTTTSLRGAMASADLAALRAIGSLAGRGASAFSALNLATMQDGAVIRIPAGSSVDEPLELLHIATGSANGRILSPRHLILVEAGARAAIVERYLALTDKPYFTNAVCEIELGADAVLEHQRVQQEADQAYHLSEIHARLGSSAAYRAVFASLGGRWSRTEINSGFAAADASLELQGLYLAGNGQLVDFHLDVDHAVPGCNSRVNFKGIAFGRGRAVFDGRILVQRQAQQSNAHLSNANLMLSRRSEIDTKPQLEILADDVQCSHGTTVGQLDPNALFYLRSRGFGVDQARRLLCLGFANEILNQFTHEALRAQLTDQIWQRVESTGTDTV